MNKIRCTKCNKELDPKKTVYLELSTETGHYYFTLEAEPMPAKESQGSFPFGKDCASSVGRIYYSKDNPARREIFREGDLRILSIYDRSYLPQRKDRAGKWKTIRVCKNDAEAREALNG